MDNIINKLTAALWLYGPSIIMAFAILIIGLFVIKHFIKVSRKVMAARGIDVTLQQFLGNLLGWILKILLFIVVASKLGVETTSFAAIIAAAGLAIGLALIGVDYPILWGLVAFLLNYIPNIGSVIAAIPTVTFALIQMGYDGALWTAVVFIVVNIVIGNVVEPKMMGRGMGLSTFVVFFALIFWGFILGPIGMFLSVPLTMFIKFMAARSPDTKWLAIILGNGEEAMAKLEEVVDNADHGPELTK